MKLTTAAEHIIEKKQKLQAHPKPSIDLPIYHESIAISSGGGLPEVLKAVTWYLKISH